MYRIACGWLRPHGERMNGETLMFFNEFPLKMLYERWLVDVRETSHIRSQSM